MVYRRGLRTWDEIQAAARRPRRRAARRPRRPPTQRPLRPALRVARRGGGLRAAALRHRLAAPGRVAAWLALAGPAVAAEGRWCPRGSLLRRPGRGRVPVHAGGRPRPRHRAGGHPGGAAGAGGHLAAGGGGIRRAAGGGPAGTRQGRRCPRCPRRRRRSRHRVGGPPGRGGPLARGLASRHADRPRPLLDAVLGWVVREASAEARRRRRAGAEARVRALDMALVALAAVPALTLAA